MDNGITSKGIEYHRPARKRKIFAFLIFIALAFALIYYSFGGGFGFAGKTISGETNESQTLENRIKIDAKLTIPDLEMKGEYTKIEIEGSSSSFFKVGSGKFSLQNSQNNFITINDYEGKISFNSNGNLNLDGKAREVSINKIPVTSDTNKKVKVEFDEEFTYKTLKISGDAQIPKILYTTSGSIDLNDHKTTLKIEEEMLTIKNFVGSLSLKKEEMKLDGFLTSLKVEGQHEFSISV